MNCKEIISNFIKEELNGDIDKFSEYDFAKLEGTAYDKCRKDFDADNTLLCRCIMYLMFKDDLPELMYSEIGTGKKYRGDTIHTIKKLFTKKERESNKICSDSDIKKYKKLHHTIGNFMLLPNSGKGTNTLNCARSGRVKDVFPWFINDLDAFFTKKELVDHKIEYLIKENNWYFKKIESVQKFCEINLLEKSSMDSIINYHSFMKKCESDKDDIKYDIKLEMVRDFNKMIESRSKKIIVKLKKIL